MTYTVDYFLQKFEAIPEERWCEDRYTSLDGQSHCALGLCGNEIERRALRNVLEPVCGGAVELVNDKWLRSRYPQPTPKQRILAALRDVKGAG